MKLVIDKGEFDAVIEVDKFVANIESEGGEGQVTYYVSYVGEDGETSRNWAEGEDVERNVGFPTIDEAIDRAKQILREGIQSQIVDLRCVLQELK